jgi:hypothetical protein
MVHDVNVLLIPTGKYHQSVNRGENQAEELRCREKCRYAPTILEWLLGAFAISNAVTSPRGFESSRSREDSEIAATGMNLLEFLRTEVSPSVPDMERRSYDAKENSWSERLKEGLLDYRTQQDLLYEL